MRRNYTKDTVTFEQETCPPSGSVTVRILTACRIAQRYRGRVPTAEELQREFSMSRAAAFRWRAAMKLAMRPERPA